MVELRFSVIVARTGRYKEKNVVALLIGKARD